MFSLVNSEAATAKAIDHRILGSEEEKRLLEKCLMNDQEAVNQLIACNQRLVASICHKYYQKDYEGVFEFSDLMQVGNIGLLKAIDHWDASKNVKFNTYAYYWVRSYVRRMSILRATNFSISNGFAEKLVVLRRTMTKLTNKLQRDPNVEEIAKETGFTLEEVENGLMAIRKSMSIEKNFNEDDDKSARFFQDILADPEQDTEGDGICKALASQALKIIYEDMPLHWRYILINRFGLEGNEPQSQAVIAFKYKVSRQNIEQMEKSALKYLKKRMNNKNMI